MSANEIELDDELVAFLKKHGLYNELHDSLSNTNQTYSLKDLLISTQSDLNNIISSLSNIPKSIKDKFLRVINEYKLSQNVQHLKQIAPNMSKRDEKGINALISKMKKIDNELKSKEKMKWQLHSTRVSLEQNLTAIANRMKKEIDKRCNQLKQELNEIEANSQNKLENETQRLSNEKNILSNSVVNDIMPIVNSNNNDNDKDSGKSIGTIVESSMNKACFNENEYNESNEYKTNENMRDIYDLTAIKYSDKEYSSLFEELLHFDNNGTIFDKIGNLEERIDSLEFELATTNTKCNALQVALTASAIDSVNENYEYEYDEHDEYDNELRNLGLIESDSKQEMTNNNNNDSNDSNDNNDKEEKKNESSMDDINITQEMINNPFDAKWIESFEVMDKEIGKYEKQMESDAINLNEKLKKSISNQIKKLKTKQSRLMKQVQNGILNEMTYSQRVKSCMMRDMKLRKKLIALNRHSDAKEIAARVLLMKREVFGDTDPNTSSSSNTYRL